MLNKALLVLAGLAAVSLAGCVTATPYQPAAKGLGYAEQRLETNRYKVTFAGNSSTPRETVETYLLYRAAEVTLQNGYDYFVLVDQSTDKDTTYTWYPYSYWGPGFGPGFGASSGTSMPRSEYQAQANILIFKGAKDPTNNHAFDARDLKSNLEASIKRPQPAKG